MADTDVFLQLEKLKRSPTPRRRPGRGARRQTNRPTQPAARSGKAKGTPPGPSSAVAQTLLKNTKKTSRDADKVTPKTVQDRKTGVTTPRTHDVATDVMASLIQDINTKLWREIIEETETHNSSLRMSAREREQIEDVVRELKRKHRIKTSMNEVARLGLLFLIHDFKRRGEQSLIAEVKTS